MVKITPLEGGKEARARALDLSRMALRLCEKKGWKTEILDAEGLLILATGVGIERLAQEAGGHRFVAEDPRSGKRHTSFCAVSVSFLQERSEGQIDPADVAYSFQKASGPGGQHVNKTESAVRATHAPSGLSVLVQSGRCQHENKRLALKVLQSKWDQQRAAEREASQRAQRDGREAVGFGSADRSYRLKEDACVDARSGRRMSAKRALGGECDQLWAPEAQARE